VGIIINMNLNEWSAFYTEDAFLPSILCIAAGCVTSLAACFGIAGTCKRNGWVLFTVKRFLHFLQEILNNSCSELNMFYLENITEKQYSLGHFLTNFWAEVTNFSFCCPSVLILICIIPVLFANLTCSYN